VRGCSTVTRVDALVTALRPRVAGASTPNVPEAGGAHRGLEIRTVDDPGRVRRGGLVELGARAARRQGGHLDGPPSM
jgi:hypothetical protein